MLLQPIYRSDAKNPLPGMDPMLCAIEYTNFFENRATEYSKAATRATWEEAFSWRQARAGQWSWWV